MLKKPKVKLMTMWMLDNEFEKAYWREIPDHVISYGIWMPQGAEIKTDENGNKRRIYTMVCIKPHHEKLKIGTKIKMEESLIIELCHRVKLVHLPKYKSIIKP